MYGCACAWTEAKICQTLSAFLLVVGYSWILNCLHFVYQYFLASIEPGLNLMRHILNVMRPKIPATVIGAHSTLRTTGLPSFFFDGHSINLPLCKSLLLSFSQWEVEKQVQSENNGEPKVGTLSDCSHVVLCYFPVAWAPTSAPAVPPADPEVRKFFIRLATITWEAINWPSP